jgi:hypothetical protein
MIMKSKQKSGQGSKQSERERSNEQAGNQGSRSGTQGGTHEQHVEAGRQSHKNDDKQTASRQSDVGNKNDSHR